MTDVAKKRRLTSSKKGKNDMNDGVAMLLERMKTNPEEFDVGYSTKWNHLINAYKETLEPEDRQALTNGVNKLMQQRFTEKVMEELIDPKDAVSLKSMAHPRNTPMATTTRGLYSNGIGGNATLLAQQKLQVEQMRLQLDAQRLAMEQEENKKPATLFGRLFNYQ